MCPKFQDQSKPIELTMTHNFFSGERPQKAGKEQAEWDASVSLCKKLWLDGQIGIRFAKVKDGKPVPNAEAMCALLNEMRNLSPDECYKIMDGKDVTPECGTIPEWRTKPAWGTQAEWAALSRVDRVQLKLLFGLARDGGAVIGNYRHAAEADWRLVGLVAAASKFVVQDQPSVGEFHQVVSLQVVDKGKVYHSSGSFLGNLAPMQTTLQSCDARAKGRLSALAQGQKSDPDVFALHSGEVEWLVNNWLWRHGPKCGVVHSGGASEQAIDHKGYDEDRRLTLAQTTVTSQKQAVKDKLDALEPLEADLKYLFAPEAALVPFEAWCKAWRKDGHEPTVVFESIETVFANINATKAGKAMIESMFEAKSVDPKKVNKNRTKLDAAMDGSTEQYGVDARRLASGEKKHAN